MRLGRQLLRVREGRFFVRSAAASPSSSSGLALPSRQATMLFGVVALPNSVQTERMHDVRLNSSFWLDDESARPPRCESMDESTLREATASDILTNLKFAAGWLPDSFEVFVRETMLEHETPGMRWAYVMGATANRLQVTPEDGLYELAGEPNCSPRLVSSEPCAGMTPDLILRHPLWGPGGRFGLSTSMEPRAFTQWLQAERSRPRRAYEDPDFPVFVERLNRRVPETHVYTLEQQAARAAAAREVLLEVLRERAHEPQPQTASGRQVANAAPARRPKP